MRMAVGDTRVPSRGLQPASLQVVRGGGLCAIPRVAQQLPQIVGIAPLPDDFVYLRHIVYHKWYFRSSVVVYVFVLCGVFVIEVTERVIVSLWDHGLVRVPVLDDLQHGVGLRVAFRRVCWTIELLRSENMDVNEKLMKSCNELQTSNGFEV